MKTIKSALILMVSFLALNSVAYANHDDSKKHHKKTVKTTVETTSSADDSDKDKD